MEKRDEIIPVRISKEEKNIIIEKAKKLGLKLSTFLRLAALEK